MRKTLILALILGLALLLRLPFLDKFPAGFSGDEVGQGVTAYSILHTGHDEWGEFLPLFPRGFGDFKPPMLSYVIIPSLALFGLNEFAVRLPVALIGVLTVFITFLLCKEWFGKDQIGLWAAFLLAISPWHIQLSRTAFEGNLGIFLFTLGLWTFFKGLKSSKYLILTALFWGLTFYTYHSYKLFVPFFALGVYLINFKVLTFKKILLPVILGVIISLPLLVFSGQNTARFSDVSIFKDAKSTEVLNRKFESPNAISRIVMTNPVVILGEVFINNYLSYYSPAFFFTGNRSDSSYLNFPFTSLMYPLELILVISFFGLYLKGNFKESRYILLWLLVAPIPAAISSGEGSANRAVTFLPLPVIISALGLVCLVSYLQKRKLYSWVSFKLINLSLVAFLLINLVFFMYQYVFYIPNKKIDSIRYGYPQIFSQAISKENDYDQIVLSHIFTNPQAYIEFYKLKSISDPEKQLEFIHFYQQSSSNWLQYKSEGKLFVDQLPVYNLGKYQFRDTAWNDDRSIPNLLLVSKTTDFPEHVETVFEYRNKLGTTLYKGVDTNVNSEIKL